MSTIILFALISLVRPELQPAFKSLQDDAEESPSYIHYSEIYRSLLPAEKPFAFVVLVFWLLFLFSFVGIVASDFFCPNLATISARLGLSESVAGVTFLAFGNGSPDVFSTFSAMKTGAASLAIGELLGAASFIVAVVGGSMALVQPFEVDKVSFTRDILFFILAICAILGVLFDGSLTAWEAAFMLTLYGVYVCTVVGMTYYKTKKELQEERMMIARSHFAEDEEEVARNPYRDEEVQSPPRGPSLRLDTSVSTLSRPTATPNTPFPNTSRNLFPHRRSRSIASDPFTPSTAHPNRSLRRNFSVVRPSLLGAVEFRDVINSLASATGSQKLHAFASLSPTEGRHPLTRTRSRALTAVGATMQVPFSLREERDRVAREREADNNKMVHSAIEPSSYSARVWEDRIADYASTYSRDSSNPPSPTESTLIDLREGMPNPWKTISRSSSLSRAQKCSNTLIPSMEGVAPGQRIPEPTPNLESELQNITFTVPTNFQPKSLPAIQLTNDENESVPLPFSPISPVDGLSPSSPIAKGQIAKLVLMSLFPSIHDWKTKSFLGKILGVLSLPAILLLKLTLPVVNTDEEEVDEEKESVSSSIKEGDGYEKEVEETVVRCLTTVQCTLAPVFVVLALLGTELRWWYPLAAIAVGLVLGSISYSVFTHSEHRGRFVLCFVGFAVAMVWILTIVGEVVGILQTFGFILGISDAIMGLTIFAMGNSLGDFVANVTIAKMGFPMMAISACFGGPMLNILFGVGLSGTLVIARRGQEYSLSLGRPLWISGIGLLVMLVGTLISVWASGWWMNRKLGVGLIMIYVAILTVNVTLSIHEP